MINDFYYIIVFLYEIVDMFDIKLDGIYVDVILGGVGYSEYFFL